MVSFEQMTLKSRFLSHWIFIRIINLLIPSVSINTYSVHKIEKVVHKDIRKKVQGLTPEEPLFELASKLKHCRQLLLFVTF